MVVCDKCKGNAEYFITVDYLRAKGMHTFDLCEKHYNEMYALIAEKNPTKKSKGKILMEG